MKKYSIFLWIGCLFLLSCNSAQKQKAYLKNETTKNIARIEKILTNDTTGNINIAAAYEIIKYYSTYSINFPDDSATPEYLFRKANIYNALNQGKNAIDVLEKIQKEYPNFHKTGLCLFMEANIYENQLKDLDKARNAYQKFITLYPHHPLANDAKVLLENLGKTPEELFQSFSKKNDGQTAHR